MLSSVIIKKKETENTVQKYKVEIIVHGTWKDYTNYSVTLLMPK